MSNATDNAFPVTWDLAPDDRGSEPGMDLRTYLAGQAMAAIIQSREFVASDAVAPVIVAKTSIHYADALISQLNKIPTP